MAADLAARAERGEPEDLDLALDARGVVLGHHERFDGKGYHYGLTGDEIPIAARIVTVADVFDAVTENRPYHAGESVVHALDELRKGAGSQFDPKVVDAFFDVLHVVHQPKIAQSN